MEFNIYFDITSIIFLALICWRFFRRRLFPTPSITCFGTALIVALFNLVLDVFGSVSLYYLNVLPLIIPYVLNTLYFTTQIAMPTAIAVYLIAILKPIVNIPKSYEVLTFVPCIIFEAVLLLTLPFGGVFSITSQGYSRGPLSGITYICCAIYLIIGIFISNKYRHIIPKNVSKSFAFSVLFIIISIVIQFIFPNLLISGTAIAASLVTMFFEIQNPSDMIDPQTGLFNYTVFQEIASDIVSSEKEAYLVAVDVHGLKRCNLLYGVNEGDNVFRKICDYLAVDSNGWNFRVLDTLIVMLTNNRNDYLNYLGKVATRKAYNWPINDHETTEIYLSVCYMENVQTINSASKIMNIVENAITSQSNNSSKDYVYEISNEIVEGFNRKTNIEIALNEYDDIKDRFVVFYQPIFNYETNKYDALEALLRFNHQELGLLPPAEFLQIVENMGLASMIDQNVITKVFDDMNTGVFDKLGIEKVHINLTAASLVNVKTRDLIIEYARNNPNNSKRVFFEITETISSLSEDECAAFIDLIKPLGYRFAIDDFGTGYSNVARLLNLPLDCIKLDKSMLDLTRDGFADVVRIIKDLNMELIAEGVEKETDLLKVINAGVMHIQGFYYAKPMELNSLISFLGE